MRSTESKSSRAMKCIELAESIENSENKVRCLSMLYPLFEKFGDEDAKRKFKEAKQLIIV